MRDVLPRGEYGDPLAILIRREARTCAGCVFRAVMTVAGDRVAYCERGRPSGRRCELYRGGECGES